MTLRPVLKYKLETECVLGISLFLHSNLSNGAVLPKDVVHLFSSDLVRQVFDVQDSIHFRWQPNLNDNNISTHVCMTGWVNYYFKTFFGCFSLAKNY